MTNITKMILCLFLLLAAGGVCVKAQNAIRVSTPQGKTVIVMLDENPNITANEQEAVLTAGATSYTFPFENYVDMVFIEVDDSGVSTLRDHEEAPILHAGAGSALIENLKPGDRGAVYDLGGIMKIEYEADDDGTISIDLSRLAKGVYMVTVNGITFKILR